MEGESYPLILDGTQAGTVEVSRMGGWTVFDVRCANAGGIVRVSVYGDGKEGYLGVLAPEGEGLALRRRLSRNDLRTFPARIEYASSAGQSAAPALQAEAETPREPAEPEAPDPEESEGRPPSDDAGEEKNGAEPEQKRTPPPSYEDVYWYASPDGALVCFDGEQNLIALPEGDARIPKGVKGLPRMVEGRGYIVFRTKDGRLLSDGGE